VPNPPAPPPSNTLNQKVTVEPDTSAQEAVDHAQDLKQDTAKATPPKKIKTIYRRKKKIIARRARERDWWDDFCDWF
jgi:hypothetical protein